MSLNREFEKSRTRGILFLILGIFIAMWVMYNAKTYIEAAGLYILTMATTIGLYFIFPKISLSEINERSLVGIDQNWLKDITFGIIGGGAFSFLTKAAPSLSIGIPTVSLSVEPYGRLLVIVVLAAIAEELFFRDAVLGFFKGELGLPFIAANILQAAAFALYHIAAYGGNLEAAGGSFISAAIFGFLMGYVRKYTDSNISNIAIHMIVNFTLVSSFFIVGL